MVQKREEKIAKGLSIKGIREFGAKLYDEYLFSIRHMTKEKVQRNIAYWYDAPEIQQWIENFQQTGELCTWGS